MFERAIREKWRFETGKGQLSAEDLYDLPLTNNRGQANLDDIARNLHKQLKNDDEVSFVVKERKSNSTIQAKFDLVKHIIEVRLTEDEAKSKARENAAKKQRLLELIANKQDKELTEKSIDELTAMVAELS